MRARVQALAPSYGRLGLALPDFRPRALRRPATVREIRRLLARAERELIDLERRPVSRGWLGIGGSTATAADIAPAYKRVCRALSFARGLTHRARRNTGKALAEYLQLLQTRYNLGMSRTQERMRLRIEYAQERRDALGQKARELLDARCARIRAEAESPEITSRRIAALEQRHHDEVAAAKGEFNERFAVIDRQHRTDFAALAETWRNGTGEVAAAVTAIHTAVDAINPSWDEPAWQAWAPPASPPPVLRFGNVRVELDRMSQGVPRDEPLRRELASGLNWPALLHFPERASLLIETPPAGRAAAVRVLQAVMMRFLTSMPAGRVRMTIVDPAGLGSDFGTVLHLEDQGLPVPIRTDAQQIEQSLGDLCGHVEKIIQSYLRDEHPTINEFNALANEVAEPYRILVICDFPTGFNQTACNRLAQIIDHGARCGVLTLVIADPSQAMPASITLRKFASQAVRLVWRDGRLAWDDPEFGPFLLEADPLPQQALARRVLKFVGAADEAARRVEVPFDFVAPEDGALWTADSRDGIEVGLGKGGPTKVQALSLGRSTAQHVLIAGRTGSGKSSLLHALITNLAIHYSPDEVELYLIDFKKGVEFKTYATFELPHAQVIAIESEREFGHSVL
jgi:DNA segregation ATPase FtsK/SpoIIIE, S-DNA-T family